MTRALPHVPNDSEKVPFVTASRALAGKRERSTRAVLLLTGSAALPRPEIRSHEVMVHSDTAKSEQLSAWSNEIMMVSSDVAMKTEMPFKNKGTLDWPLLSSPQHSMPPSDARMPHV